MPQDATVAANLTKLSRLIEPGRIVDTLDGSAYRVVSKVAGPEGFDFRLADLQGKPVQTPAEFHPIHRGKALFASKLRYVFAYNQDFDKFVKAYIEQAGLPTDPKMDWAKWFQKVYVPSLTPVTRDFDMKDEAIYHIITYVLQFEKALGDFQRAIKKYPKAVRKLPLAEQVTEYLKKRFTWRIGRAKEYVLQIQRPEDVSTEQGVSDEEGESYNILDTQEHATDTGEFDTAEAAQDIQKFRQAFAMWLGQSQKPETAQKYLTLFDLFWQQAQEHAAKITVSDLTQDWIKATGLGMDSLKAYYGKLPGLLEEFVRASKGQGLGEAYEFVQLIESIAKPKAKARGASVTAAMSLRIVEQTPQGVVLDKGEGAVERYVVLLRGADGILDYDTQVGAADLQIAKDLLSGIKSDKQFREFVRNQKESAAQTEADLHPPAGEKYCDGCDRLAKNCICAGCTCPENKNAAAKPKCPHCGSTDYGLMPTDFETAKCNKCGKNWDHGIVEGINDPHLADDTSKCCKGYHGRHRIDCPKMEESMKKTFDLMKKLPEKKKEGAYGGHDFYHGIESQVPPGDTGRGQHDTEPNPRKEFNASDKTAEFGENLLPADLPEEPDYEEQERNHKYCPRCMECVDCNLRPCKNGGDHLPGVSMEERFDAYQNQLRQDRAMEDMGIFQENNEGSNVTVTPDSFKPRGSKEAKWKVTLRGEGGKQREEVVGGDNYQAAERAVSKKLKPGEKVVSMTVAKQAMNAPQLSPDALDRMYRIQLEGVAQRDCEGDGREDCDCEPCEAREELERGKQAAGGAAPAAGGGARPSSGPATQTTAPPPQTAPGTGTAIAINPESGSEEEERERKTVPPELPNSKYHMSNEEINKKAWEDEDDSMEYDERDSDPTIVDQVQANLRLEYLRGELRAERISTEELMELQGLVDYIDPGDVELLEAAGVEEFPEPVVHEKAPGGEYDKDLMQSMGIKAKKKAALPSTQNTPEMQGKIEAMIQTYEPILQHQNAQVVYEHGHWWVSCGLCGAIWDVVDASGPGSMDGLDLEEVDNGDGECFEQQGEGDDTSPDACDHVPHDPDTMQSVCETCGAEITYDAGTNTWSAGMEHESSMEKKALEPGADSGIKGSSQPEYIYQADLWCEACAVETAKAIDAAGKGPQNPADESTYDSDDYPKGPFFNEESDTPNYCAGCKKFLENPLTTTGYEYINEAIADFDGTGRGDAATIAEWKEFYPERLEYENNILDHEASEKTAEIDMGQVPSAQDIKDKQPSEKKPTNWVSSTGKQKALPGIPEGMTLLIGFHGPDGDAGRREARFWVLMDSAGYQRIVKSITKNYGHSPEQMYRAQNALFNEIKKHAEPVEPGTSSDQIEEQFRTKKEAAMDNKQAVTLDELKKQEEEKNAQPKQGGYHGLYVWGTYTPYGLTMTATRELLDQFKSSEEINEEQGTSDWKPDLYEMLEDWTGNGWEWVRPEDIGALTSGEIISDPDGNIYWHERYQIEDAAQELLSGAKVQWQYGGNMHQEEEPTELPSDPNQMELPMTSADKTADGESDFMLENHGSIAILQPLSAEANSWVEENIGSGPDVTTYGGGIVVEPRYVEDIINGIEGDGLSIKTAKVKKALDPSVSDPSYDTHPVIELLWDYLPKEGKDRVRTGWGSKSKQGLVLSLERAIQDAASTKQQ